MSDNIHLYSTRTATLGGLVEIKIDAMWYGRLRITLTILSTGETKEIEESELDKLSSARWDGESDCDYVNS